MLSYDAALAIATERIATIDELEDDDLILLPERTIERPFGWVFFYTSRRYHETGDFRYALAGNAPLMVNRFSGDVVGTGTAHSTQHYIDAYEAALARSQ